MKKVFAGLFVLLIALTGLVAIVDLGLYRAEKHENLPDGPAPLTEDQREAGLDRSHQPQGADAPPSPAGPGELALLPPAAKPGGEGRPEPAAAIDVAETPETQPAAAIPVAPAEPQADAGTGSQPVKSAEPKQTELFGLLTDTGETEENQILDPQAAQTALVTSKHRAQPAKIAAARQKIKVRPRRPAIRSTPPSPAPRLPGADGPTSPRGSPAGG
jgi:hypothetical protein